MPSKDVMTYEWIAQVISGKKKLILVTHLKTMTMPPKVNGLSIATIWDEVKKYAHLMQYFPDFHGRVPPKDFFFNVASH